MSTLSGDLYSKSLRITQHVNVIIPDESEDFWTKIDDEAVSYTHLTLPTTSRV